MIGITKVKKYVSSVVALLILNTGLPLPVFSAEAVSVVLNAGTPIPQITPEEAAIRMQETSPLPNPNAPKSPLSARSSVMETAVLTQPAAVAVPVGATVTLSNPNYFYKVRQLSGSSILEVYDIVRADGTLVTSLTKKTANLRGSWTESLTPPDVSADGKRATMAVFSTSMYTGHILESANLETYTMPSGALETPITILLSKDNQKLTANEKPSKVNFDNGSTTKIKVTYPDGRETYVQKQPAGSIMTQSNPNFFYIARQQGGSVPEVYDILRFDGTVVATVPKKTENVQGNFSESLTAPDVSADGTRIIYSMFQQSYYTGHTIQRVTIESYSAVTGQADGAKAVLVERDNVAITSADKPIRVRFSSNLNNAYEVTYSGGLVKTVPAGYMRSITVAPSNSAYNFERITTKTASGEYLHTLNLLVPGTSGATLLTQLVTATGTSPYLILDVSPDATRVVFTSLAAKNPQGVAVAQAAVIRPVTGTSPAPLTIAGAISIVTFSGADILLKTGFNQGDMMIRVDSATLKIKSYERTWTAKSNSSYTFTDITTVTASGVYQHQLQMYKAGTTSIKVLSQLYTANTDTPFYLMDVSPDGTRLAYAYKDAKSQSGSTVPAGIYVGSTTATTPVYTAIGTYKSIVFSQNKVILTKTDGTVVTLKIKRLKPI